MISSVYDPQANAYDTYDHLSRYDRDEGLLVLPLAKAGTGTAADHKIITVHAPVAYRQVEWDAHKYGSPPLMPAPITTPSGDIPLGSEIGVAMPALGSGQGDYVFRAAGRYRYVQAVPRGPDNAASLSTGWYPFVVPLIIAQLVGLLGGGLITGLLSDPTRRAAVEADQETAAGANFTNHQNDLDFRYYSPNYSSQLFSSDLIR